MDSPPEEPPETQGLWDFSEARRFLQNLHSGFGSDDRGDSYRLETHSTEDHVPTSLGDFGKLFSKLASRQPSHFDSVIVPCGRSNKPTLSTTGGDVSLAGTAKAVRWTDETRGGSTEKKAGNLDGVGRMVDYDNTAHPVQFSSLDKNQRRFPPEPASQNWPSTGSQVQSVNRDPHLPSHTLIPMPASYLDSSYILPLHLLTDIEQKIRLVRLLISKFPDEKDILVSDSRLNNKHRDGIHIFVDCSNIVIGFQNRLKYNRGIHTAAYVRPAPISYRSLALIFERGRRVCRRVLVGSNPRLYASGRGLPEYVKEAARYGYEINMLERVQKLRPSIVSKKKGGTGNGYTTSGQSSGSEAPHGTPTIAEQGVDELLQMKLLESMFSEFHLSPCRLAMVLGFHPLQQVK